MKNLPVKDLKPGMILEKAIYTKYGQLIMEKGTVLTDELISRLSFYNIYNAAIKDNQDTSAEHKSTEAKPPTPSIASNTFYSNKVKAQPEFMKYQIAHNKEINSIKEIFDAVIANPEAPVDFRQILSDFSELINSCRTTVAFFDKLHNMRQDDDSVYAHCLNVALISRMMGQWLKLDAKERDILTLCGLFHDIGKTSIPDEVLNKPGKYTDEEFALIKQHPLFSYKLIKHQPIDERIKQAALQHHERWDGSGYPQKIKGDAIDDFAAIVAIADVYDATTAARSYRPPLCPFQAIDMFEKDGLTKYHPKYILTFLNRIATTYQHNRILLNTGQSANIVMINPKHLTRPIIQMDDDTVIDMLDNPELEITKII